MVGVASQAGEIRKSVSGTDMIAAEPIKPSEPIGDADTVMATPAMP
jgi:hypothetical protein